MSRGTTFVAVLALALVAGAAWRFLRTPAGDGADVRAVAGRTATGAAAGDAAAGAGTIARAPFDGADPEAADAPALCEAYLRGADDRPLIGADALLLKGGAWVARERADGEGAARFPADGAEATLVVLADGAAPFRTTLVCARGAVIVRAPGAAAVAGRALVDGAAPREPLALTFRPEDGFPGTADLPPTEPGVRRTDVVRLDVAADGAFRLTGLAEGAIGRLAWPTEFEHEDSATPRALVVTAPTKDLVLRLRRAPLLTGRVVGPDGRTPIPKAEVVVRIQWGMLAQDFAVVADSEGRFVQGLAKCPSSGLPPATVDLTATDSEGRGRVRRAVSGAFDRACDAGDVALAAEAPERAIRALRAGGAAADAAASGAEGRIFRADETGRIVVDGPGPFQVGAPGCVRATVGDDAFKNGEAVVDLADGAALEIVALNAAGKVAEGRVVRVRSAGLLPGGVVDPLFRALCVGEIDAGGRFDGTGRLFVRPDAEGRVLVPEIAADADADVALMDGTGSDAAVLREATVNVGRGKQRVTLREP